MGPQIALLGADVAKSKAKPGDILDVTLYWKALEPIEQSYTIFVQVIGQQFNPDGNPVWGQRDEPPCQDTFPTTAWEPGATILTRHHVAIADEAPAGAYRVDVGMYYLPSGERLSVLDVAGQPVAGNSATVMHLDVQP